MVRTGFNEAERLTLRSLAQHPGIDLLQDLMEMECVKQDTNLVNARNTEEILRQHSISQAMWLFFIRMQKQMIYEVSEAGAAEAEATAEEQAAAARDHLLDPVKQLISFRSDYK